MLVVLFLKGQQPMDLGGVFFSYFFLPVLGLFKAKSQATHTNWFNRFQ